MIDEILMEAETIRADYTDADGAALWKLHRNRRKQRRMDPGDDPTEEEKKMELKECPHCGGEAFLNANYSQKISRFFIFAKCEECGATGGTTCTKDDPQRYGWNLPACKRAITAWNMRTTEAQALTVENAIALLREVDPETWDEIRHGE